MNALNIDIEAMRTWLKAKSIRDRALISESTGYPIDSLNKFAQGQVAEPRFRNLGRLLALYEQRQ